MQKLFIILLTIQLCATACSSKKEENQQAFKSNAADEANDYPDIILHSTDGTEVRTKSLEGNNIFIFFQPDCDHCQEEAVLIEQRLDEFKDYTLYFISSASLEQIADFGKNFQLLDRPNVKFAWTTTEGVLNNYGPIQTPSLYIYSNGHLKQSFNGQTDVDKIIAAL